MRIIVKILLSNPRRTKLLHTAANCIPFPPVKEEHLCHLLVRALKDTGPETYTWSHSLHQGIDGVITRDLTKISHNTRVSGARYLLHHLRTPLNHFPNNGVQWWGIIDDNTLSTSHVGFDLVAGSASIELIKLRLSYIAISSGPRLCHLSTMIVNHP